MCVITPLDFAATRLCAYRLDPNVSAEKFVQTIIELVDIVNGAEPDEAVEAQDRNERLENQILMLSNLLNLERMKIQRASQRCEELRTMAASLPKVSGSEVTDALEEVFYILREKVERNVPEESED